MTVQITLLEADEVQKVWQGPKFAQGIYHISFPIEDGRFYPSDGWSHFYGQGPWNFAINFERDLRFWFKAMTLNHVKVENQTVHVIGRFLKKGREYYFQPETKKQYDFRTN